MTLNKFLIIGIAALALAGCNQTLTAEPAPGTLRSGAKVLVDDGTCPEGQIKQVTGSSARGIPRKRECIARPA